MLDHGHGLSRRRGPVPLIIVMQAFLKWQCLVLKVRMEALTSTGVVAGAVRGACVRDEDDQLCLAVRGELLLIWRSLLSGVPRVGQAAGCSPSEGPAPLVARPGSSGPAPGELGGLPGPASEPAVLIPQDNPRLLFRMRLPTGNPGPRNHFADIGRLEGRFLFPTESPRQR